MLTVVDGKIVYAGNEFAACDLELPTVSPDWSPVNRFGSYHNSHGLGDESSDTHHGHEHLPGQNHWVMGADGRAWQTGCGCGV